MQVRVKVTPNVGVVVVGVKVTTTSDTTVKLVESLSV